MATKQLKAVCEEVVCGKLSNPATGKHQSYYAVHIHCGSANSAIAGRAALRKQHVYSLKCTLVEQKHA